MKKLPRAARGGSFTAAFSLHGKVLFYVKKLRVGEGIPSETRLSLDVEDAMNNRQSIETLKGIGEKTAKLFEKIGVKTVDDIIEMLMLHLTALPVQHQKP